MKLSTDLYNFFYKKELYKNNLEKSFLSNFRAFYNIPLFTMDDDNIIIKYFFDITDDFNEEESSLKTKTFNPILQDDLDLELPSESSNIFHERTMTILEIVRRAFPSKKKYKINGVGYDIFDLGSKYDPTSKNIPIENLPINYLTLLNGLVINLFEYEFRPNTWEEYITKISEKRKERLSAITDFRKGLIIYFKNETKGINYFIENESEIKSKIFDSENYKLPKIISDQWCYYGDTTK